MDPSRATKPLNHDSVPPGCLDDVAPGIRQRLKISPAYFTAQGRDLRIDMLRGYFVFAMIIDHLRGPSPLYLLTGGNRFYTSAAEGFILTSGLVTGLVYKRIIEREGIAAAFHRVLTRAMSLYLLAIGLTLLFVPVSELLGLPWAQGLDLSQPLPFVVSVLTLHRTYYLVDVVLLYTILFLVAPMAMVLITRGKTKQLLAGSFALWGLHQFFPEYVALPWPIAGNYLFQFSAWQLLFFVGLALGFHRDRLPVLTCNRRRVLLAVSAIAVIGLIVVYFVLDPPLDATPPDIAQHMFGADHETRLWLVDTLFAKADLRPGRLFASTAVFSFLFLLLTTFWKPIERATGWLLLLLGQHSLYAYTAHIFFAGMVGLLVIPLDLHYPGPQLFNALVQGLSVLVIWLFARRQVLAPTPRTRRLWMSSPIGIAVAMLLLLSYAPLASYPSVALAAPADPSQARALGTPVRRTNPLGTPLPRINSLGTPVPKINPLGTRLAEPPSTAPQVYAPGASAPKTNTLGTPLPKVNTLGTPVPKVNALGTPAPKVNSLGTPVPKLGGLETPAPAVAAAPVGSGGDAPAGSATPSASGAALQSIGGDVVISEYVGDLQGTLFERTFYSAALDNDMPYYIYLPPDYSSAGRRYPVLYMLHGAYGHRDEWLAYDLVEVADQQIRSGNLPPVIIVLPQGDESYWTNWAGDGPRWGDYIWNDLVHHVDSSYRTLRDRSARAVGGLSMGAWGALSMTLTHPETFGVVGVHSPSLRGDDGSIGILGTGEELAKKDPMQIIQSMTQVPYVQLMLDVGQDDPFRPRVEELHQMLVDRGAVHDWHIFAGGHESEYWHAHVLDYLRFYAFALYRQ